MRLSEFQNSFKDLMLDNPDALERIPEDLSAMFHVEHIPISERLLVYRNNIVGGITDMLVATFPMLKSLVGEKFLESMARSFLMQNPPSSGCLNFYGAGFGEFIEGFEPAKGLPYLPDMARLEIAINEAYYARDDEAIAPDKLLEGGIKLRNSVSILRSDYPLLELRDFCLDSENTPAPNIDSGGCVLMVYRHAFKVEVVALREGEFDVLTLIQNNSSLEQAFEKYPDFDFERFLERQINFETFSAVDTNKVI